MAQKGTSEFEHMSTETSQTKQQREKWGKILKNTMSKNVEQSQKFYVCVMAVLGEEKEKGIKEIFEAIRTENFSKLMNTKL